MAYNPREYTPFSSYMGQDDTTIPDYTFPPMNLAPPPEQSILGSARDFLTRAVPGSYEEQIPQASRTNDLVASILLGGLKASQQASQPRALRGNVPWVDSLVNTALNSNEYYNNMVGRQAASMAALQSEQNKVLASNAADKRADAAMKLAEAAQYNALFNRGPETRVFKEGLINGKWYWHYWDPSAGQFKPTGVEAPPPSSTGSTTTQNLDKRLRQQEAMKLWQNAESRIAAYEKFKRDMSAMGRDVMKLPETDENRKTYKEMTNSIIDILTDMKTNYPELYKKNQRTYDAYLGEASASASAMAGGATHSGSVNIGKGRMGNGLQQKGVGPGGTRTF